MTSRTHSNHPFFAPQIWPSHKHIEREGKTQHPFSLLHTVNNFEHVRNKNEAPFYILCCVLFILRFVTNSTAVYPNILLIKSPERCQKKCRPLYTHKYFTIHIYGNVNSFSISFGNRSNGIDFPVPLSKCIDSPSTCWALLLSRYPNLLCTSTNCWINLQREEVGRWKRTIYEY